MKNRYTQYDLMTVIMELEYDFPGITVAAVPLIEKLQHIPMLKAIQDYLREHEARTIPEIATDTFFSEPQVSILINELRRGKFVYISGWVDRGGKQKTALYSFGSKLDVSHPKKVKPIKPKPVLSARDPAPAPIKPKPPAARDIAASWF